MSNLCRAKVQTVLVNVFLLVTTCKGAKFKLHVLNNSLYNEFYWSFVYSTLYKLHAINTSHQLNWRKQKVAILNAQLNFAKN